MYLYLKYERMKFIDYLGLIFVSAFIYYFPNSRTSAIVMFLAMIMISISKIIQYNKIKVLEQILRQIILICSILSVVALSLYGNNEI